MYKEISYAYLPKNPSELVTVWLIDPLTYALTFEVSAILYMTREQYVEQFPLNGKNETLANAPK